MQKVTRLIAGLFLTWFLVPESSATLLLTNDVTDTQVTFENASNFSGALVTNDNLLTVRPSALGDSGTFTFNFTNGPVINASAAGDSHIAISNLVVTPTQASFRETSTDGAIGIVDFAYAKAANTGSSKTFVNNGFNVFEGFSNNWFSQVSGSPRTTTIVMPGNWSIAGTATGDHELLAFNPLWTIDQNFMYSDGATTFSAHIDSYTNDGLHNLGLCYELIGAAATVPEPATFCLLGLGLAGIGLSRRKKA